tara:strand:+ start:452 stop:772 length:321 start_codon:yes stop_codon:yes gene_type:complete
MNFFEKLLTAKFAKDVIILFLTFLGLMMVSQLLIPDFVNFLLLEEPFSIFIISKIFALVLALSAFIGLIVDFVTAENDLWKSIILKLVGVFLLSFSKQALYFISLI